MAGFLAAQLFSRKAVRLSVIVPYLSVAPTLRSAHAGLKPGATFEIRTEPISLAS